MKDMFETNDTPPAAVVAKDVDDYYLSIPQEAMVVGAAAGGAVVGAAAGLVLVGGMTAAYHAGYYAGSSQPKIAPGTQADAVQGPGGRARRASLSAIRT